MAGEAFDALLIDLNYTRDIPRAEGLELLAQLSAHDSRLRIIVMTAWANVELAVESMRLAPAIPSEAVGASGGSSRLCAPRSSCGGRCGRPKSWKAENRLLRAEGRPELIAKAASMQPVLELLARIGPSDANVLITGEHGTGKEIVVAQTLHALSSRASRSLVAVNTGALAEGTFESELFGHVKGAFTDARTDRIGRFELADRGTLFLDEIANVPMRQQAKLLRVLETGDLERVGSSQTRRVNVRLLSATNADLQEECAQGRFREDLLFRLNTVEIHLPPLRDRREDIPLLAGHFLARYTSRYRKAVTGFEPNAVEAMLQHNWPGNVRELDHAIERAVLMARSPRIQNGDLGLSQVRSSAQSLDDLSLEAVESILIRKALTRAGGNVSHAAEALGFEPGRALSPDGKVWNLIPLRPMEVIQPPTHSYAVTNIPARRPHSNAASASSAC